MALWLRFETMTIERGNRYLVDSLAAKSRPAFAADADSFGGRRPECGVSP
jgi:hypothetical protein